ncbi:MAG TPA: winged helix-turn-helix transcriptional regulator [Actinomycetota bacterium]|nr:winged helix-turn-helix transcriptional regulator [Actinomycetota bacterium]
MGRREYGQYCPLAKTLDIVGERWTLLVVRELLVGPKRYSDLADSLQGIGTSLLAERLRRLEREGIVERRHLDPPAASVVYELTADGRDLARALGPLLLWGARRMGRPRRGDEFRIEWIMSFLATVCDRAQAGGLTETYEFRFPQGSFHVRAEDGLVSFHDGPAHGHADLIITTRPEILMGIANGSLDIVEHVRAGAFEVVGSSDAREHALRILWPAPEAAL